ncbi:MAG: GNAT family N-acetyltransferase [Desulfobacteraceae bacterium]|jgi:N-acetylglutamate synthase-like GNAT family acetyltransferase
MPKLYIEEYRRALTGKSVFIACREGILRDHFTDIVSDIKFLNRQGIVTTLFHNMSNRFANQKHFRQLAARLSDTRIVRLSPESDFYGQVLDYQNQIHKLIFLERKYLIDLKGEKINALTTSTARSKAKDMMDMIANINVKGMLERICQNIENGSCERVHILPAGKNTIKYELFTLEGSGTLIANNFTESFSQVSSIKEANIVAGILKIYRHAGFLKPRTKTYILEHKNNFYVTKIDGIIVGCVEKKIIDNNTIELGAVAISTKFRNQRIGVFTITAFIQEMILQGYNCFISLTNNPKLKILYQRLGFLQQTPVEYQNRQKLSDNVQMFVKRVV